MLSILVASCLHLDSTYIGRFDPKRGIHENWAEALNQLSKMVDYCNNFGVDYLLLNGDVLHSGRPSAEAIVRISNELNRLDDTLVIMEPGNHDLTGVIDRHSDPLSVFFSDKRWCDRVVTSPDVLVLQDQVALALMPWARVAGASRLEEVSTQVRDDVLRLADDVEALDMPSLFAGHLLTLTAAQDFSRRGSETQIGNTGLEAVIDEAVLDEGPWDRYALGHLHTQQDVGTAGKGLYTGSTHRVTFNEEKEKKGAFLYRWDDDGDCSVSFVDLGGRRLATVNLYEKMEIPLSKYEDMQEGDYLKVVLPHDLTVDQLPKVLQKTLGEVESVGINLSTPNARPPRPDRVITSMPDEEEAGPQEIMEAYIEDSELGTRDSKRVRKLFAEIEGGAA